jgi:diacylglycerol kinase family enzyme
LLAIILNTASGTASKPETAARVTELFEAAGVPTRLHLLSSPEALPALVERELAAGADAVVAGGGDGTVNTIASILAGGPTPLGVLPLGTLNHFAKVFQIPMDLDKAVGIIAKGHVARVDVGRVNDRVFVNNCSIGIYPNIVERRERLRAEGIRKWPAFFRAVQEVLRREEEVSVRLDVDGRQIVSRTPFVFVGNNEYQVEGIHLGARSQLDAGRLFAYLAPRVHTRDLPKLLTHALLGRARQDGQLQVVPAVELWIETLYAREIKVACDGELLKLKTPLHFRSWPRALGVMVSP